MSTPRRPRQPVHLILDWDGTLTAKDTMALLGGLPRARDLRLHNDQLRKSILQATAHQHGSAEDNGIVDPTSSLATASQWEDFVTAYMKDYQSHKASHYPVPPQEHPSDEHATPEKYSRWLESLRAVEYASVDRVTRSGVFRGVRTEDVASVARNALDSGALQLRKGWNTLFEMSVPQSDSQRAPTISKISIISVNWSESLIRLSLYLAAERLTHLSPARKTALLDHINDLEIRSNEIDGLDSQEGSSGRLTGIIRTAREKAEQMPEYSGGRSAAHQKLETNTADRGSMHQEEHSPFVLYIGDSATDYECLRSADFPIWLCDRDDSERRQRFDETFRPLDNEAFTPYQVCEWAGVSIHSETPWCAWARDLEEVAEFLKGLESRGQGV